MKYAFYGCTSLTEIPEDLFANCPQITEFDYTFFRVIGLKNIPQNLFDNCQNVEWLNGTFALL